MDGREFYSKIEAHDRLTWLGSKQGNTPADDEAFIGGPNGSKFAIAISAISDHSWDEIESVLLGYRQPRIMTHITRIVGYYSQLQNWNRSKLSELRDRHKGDYGLPELPPKVFAPSAPPEPVLATAAASD